MYRLKVRAWQLELGFSIAPCMGAGWNVLGKLTSFRLLKGLGSFKSPWLFYYKGLIEHLKRTTTNDINKTNFSYFRNCVLEYHQQSLTPSAVAEMASFTSWLPNWNYVADKIPVAAQAKVAVFQCFSTGLDPLRSASAKYCRERERRRRVDLLNHNERAIN